MQGSLGELVRRVGAAFMFLKEFISAGQVQHSHTIVGCCARWVFWEESRWSEAERKLGAKNNPLVLGVGSSKNGQMARPAFYFLDRLEIP